jgi:hypothetical protein
MRTETEDPAQEQLPVPIKRELRIVNGRTYEKFMFSENLNFKAAVEFEKSMKRQGYKMIEIKLAREIIDDGESNAAFRKMLDEGESTYIHDEESESRSLAAYLYYYTFDWGLSIEDFESPDHISRVVVLEKIGSEAAHHESKQKKQVNRLDKQTLQNR